MSRLNTEEDFWAKAVRGNDCWEWGAYRAKEGYGIARYQGRVWKAHRLAYELAIGPIPSGLCLDHLCRNRGCINPAHLEPVTDAENKRRGVGQLHVTNPARPPRDIAFGNKGLHWAEKTHCPQGHAYDDQNTYRNKLGSRSCRACRNRARDGVRSAG